MKNHYEYITFNSQAMHLMSTTIVKFAIKFCENVDLSEVQDGDDGFSSGGSLYKTFTRFRQSSEKLTESCKALYGDLGKLS